MGINGKAGKRPKKVDFGRERVRLVFSIVVVLGLMALTLLCFPFRFETNDDGGLRDIMAGYITGAPYPRTIYMLTVYGQLLNFLYRLAPAVPWYTCALLFFLFLSFVCVLKSFLKVAVSHGISVLKIIVLYVLFHIAFCAYYLIFLQFTLVAAVCMTAGIAIVFAEAKEDTRRVRRLDFILYLVLFWAGTVIRYRSAWLAAPFLLFVLLRKVCDVAPIRQDRFKEVLRGIFRRIFSRKPWRRVLPILCGSLAVTGLVFGYEAYYLARNPDWKAYTSYSKANTEYMNYASPSYESAPELYDAVGWSEELETAVRNWFKLDPRLTADALEYVNQNKVAYMEATVVQGEANGVLPGWRQVMNAIGENLFAGEEPKALGLLAVVLPGILLSVWLAFQKRKLFALYAIVPAVFAIAMSLWFSGTGRLPFRVLMSIIVPAAVLTLLQFLEFLGKEGVSAPASKRQTATVLILAAVVFAVDTWVLFQIFVTGFRDGLVLGIAFLACLCFLGAGAFWGLCRWSKKNPERLLAFLCLPCLLFTGLFAGAEYKMQKNLNEILGSMQLEEQYAAVDAYMREHPGDIYFYDIDAQLIFPREPFYVSPETGKPSQLMALGGSLSNSPLYDAQLEALGKEQLSIENFTEEGIYFLYPLSWAAGYTWTKQEYETQMLGILPHTYLSRLLAADYGVTEIEVVDRIGDFYCVYRYVGAS